MEDDVLTQFTVESLKEELGEDLKVFAETSWGWSELKAAAFLRQVEKRGGGFVAYCETRKGGGITLKVPHRV